MLFFSNFYYFYLQEPAPAPAPAPAPEPVPAPLENVPYVIVGGGTAAYFAVRGILARDKTAKIVVISAENELPYARTPLSKELWLNPEPSEVGLLGEMRFCAGFFL
jgi:hypothetical protein